MGFAGLSPAYRLPDQAQGEQGQQGVENQREAPVRKPSQQFQTNPGAHRPGGNHQQDQAQPLGKDKSGGAIDDRLGRVLQAHGGSEGGDGGEAFAFLLLFDKGGDQRAGSADKQADKGGNGRRYQRTHRASGHRRDRRAPTQQQDEAGDTELHQPQWQVDQKQAAQPGTQQRAGSKPEDQAQVDMAQSHARAAEVGTQLDHPVNGNDRPRWHGNRQDGQQQYTAADAQRGGNRRGEGRRRNQHCGGQRRQGSGQQEIQQCLHQ